MEFEFEKTYDGDAVFYWYDITEYMGKLFGDVLSKALICVGYGYKDDSEEEIWRLEHKLNCEVKSIKGKLIGTFSYFFDYSQDIKLYFTNGKVVSISSGEGFHIEKIGEEG